MLSNGAFLFRGSMRWMNKRAAAQEAYIPTNIEHKMNMVTHGIWIIPSVFATHTLWSRSHTGAQLLSALVYGATLVSLFSISTMFHCVFFCNGHGYDW